MPFTPSTKVYLLNVPLDQTQENQLYFASASAQTNYMQLHIVTSYTDFSFQRKDSTVRVPAHIDTLYNCNYVMYQNTNYGSKWFYCFITEMRYINDGCTELVIKTDVYQTWFLDCTFHASFVEREHATTDSPGDNTQPEGLELGEYVIYNAYESNTLSSLSIVLCCTELPTGFSGSGGKLWGMYNPLLYFAYRLDNSDDIAALEELIDDFDSAGKADAIVCVFIAPQSMIETGTNHNITGPTTAPYSANISVTNTEAKLQNSYVPRNKKLLTHPYRYLAASNNAGTSAIYQYEYFTSSPSFEITGVVSPGCSIKVTPTNYKGIAKNHDEGIMLGKLPVLPWSSDVYTNWLTQNSVNLNVGIASSVITIAGGLAATATGVGAAGGVMSIASGVTGIASTLGQKYQHSLIPNQAKGNTNGGDVVTASREHNIKFYHMGIKEEYAKLIDSYFDMYGYKTNKVKVPNLGGRRVWNYVKTISANISGPVPSADIEELKGIFNKGVTLWKSGFTFGDYTQSNTIL